MVGYACGHRGRLPVQAQMDKAEVVLREVQRYGRRVIYGLLRRSRWSAAWTCASSGSGARRSWSRCPRPSAKTYDFLVALGVRLLIAATVRSGSVETPLSAAAKSVYDGAITTAQWRGEMWRRLGECEAVAEVGPGVALPSARDGVPVPLTWR